jgi:two-component system sensor histidine kinase BaeS
MRRSLLIRLLAVSVAVAVVSIAATAWLAAVTATGGVRQEQVQALANDTEIYTTLLHFGATHPSWKDSAAVIADLERKTGRQISLVASATAAKQKTRPSAVVDPLAVDPALVPNAPADRIDPEVVGPFALTDEERALLRKKADAVVTCLAPVGPATVVIDPNGRARIKNPDAGNYVKCEGQYLDQPTDTEESALAELTGLVNGCLTRRSLSPVSLNLDLIGWTAVQDPPPDDQAVQECITTSRKEQLASYVAPAALLYVSTRAEAVPSPFDLSRNNQLRILGIAGGVLLLTILVTALAGSRLTRPLRALTRATEREARGESSAPVPVRGSDEIAQLTAAFNELSETRQRLEAQRKATTSDIAHELRTPLSNIRGWLEASQDGLRDPDPALVASLLEEALQLQHIVDDLQDLSLADAGKLELHPETVSLPELFSQLRVRLGDRATASLVTLTATAPDGLTVTADPVRLRQAIDNLVTNALRHTPTGGTVTVSARRDGDHIVIEVTDTGIGISADDLPHVFERFWRADKSRGRQSGGSGLGLAIVRRLTLAHGGTVEAASEPGVGSTFTLRLPG